MPLNFSLAPRPKAGLVVKRPSFENCLDLMFVASPCEKVSIVPDQWRHGCPPPPPSPSDNFLGALKFAIANVKYYKKYVK